MLPRKQIPLVISWTALLVRSVNAHQILEQGSQGPALGLWEQPAPFRSAADGMEILWACFSRSRGRAGARVPHAQGGTLDLVEAGISTFGRGMAFSCIHQVC